MTITVDTMDMRWKAPNGQSFVIHPACCISVTVFMVFCCTLTNGLTEEHISSCIRGNSTLAQTANCKCYRGGREGRDGRSCGQSVNVEFIDLVCSGVSAVDLPTGEVYGNITCLWVCSLCSFVILSWLTLMFWNEDVSFNKCTGILQWSQLQAQTSVDLIQIKVS